MRQGNGSDLLGLKDPRSTKIGIIYVGPSDDRKNVLTAILTQEKLGRKQIAIVLPQNQPNKAFQRPQDFDDLKTIRRRLRAQLIFIAPPGTGPAEFARQRRFSVYSSLESYTNALRAEQSPNETPTKQKKGRLFSFGEKAVPLATAIAGGAAIIGFSSKNDRSFSVTPSTPNNTIAKNGSNHAHSPYADLPTVDLSQQAPLSQRSGDSSLPTSATGTIDTSSPLTTDKNSVAAASSGAADLITHDTQQPVALDVPSTSMDEDWDALPPASLVSSPQTNAPVASLPPDTTPSSTLSSMPETPDSTIEAGPSIIEQPPSPQVSPDRSTAKPPTVGAESTATSTEQPSIAPLANNRSSQEHHTGKTAAMIGTKAVAPVQQKVGMGRSSVRGNQSTQAGITRKRSSSNNLNVIFAMIAVLLLIVAGIASCLLNPLASAKTVITITPRSKVEKDSYVIQAVTSHVDLAKRQVSLRQLTFSPPQQSKSVTATGHAKTMAKAATGQLTFYNGSAQDYWISADTTIAGPNGVSVVPDEPVHVPSAQLPNVGSTTVDAHATISGTNGNMADGAINESCCVSGDFIKVVSAAFTGGQDGENYTYLQQSDVDNVVNQLKPVLSQQAQKGFNSQIKPNEQLVGTPQCTTTSKADQPIGKQGKNVTSANVTISATCTGLVYDASGARTLAQKLLIGKASSLGQGYVLAGTIITKLTVTDVQDDIITLQVAAAGIWYYQFADSQKQTLAKQLVNASRGTAQKLLNDYNGIAKARIDVADSGDTLPNDPNQIRITVAGVSGASSAALPVMPAI